MRKCLYFLKLFICLIIFCFIFYIPVYAGGEFSTDTNVTYQISENGNAHITHDITLENNYPTIYAKSYSLELFNIKPENIVSFQNGIKLDSTVTQTDKILLISINLNKAVVGKGAKQDFQISFDINNFTEKNGEVWEFYVPKLSKSDNFRNYNLRLIIPKSFGDLSYISPDPLSRNINQNNIIFEYNKDLLSSSGIKAAFGQFQVFAYTLNYHLENPLNSTSNVEIAIPPDTAYQKIYIKNLNPKPKNMFIDDDGNWIAIYRLNRRQRLDILTSGVVQLFSSPKEYKKQLENIIVKNLLPQPYWESESGIIKNLSNQFKTPREIYDFVVNKLTYDYNRVKPNVQRLGALSALSSPESAICMEFTDLFIAISRAAGIPSREINGYAYTDNPKIKPLSLVSDVLHSWPEYYDKQKQVWVPVDPTWQNTTGGGDYFNKLDLRHFTFVIHGLDSSKPYAPGSYKLGSNPQKDVYVNFGHLPEDSNVNNVNIRAKITSKIPIISQQLNIELLNTGENAIYDTGAIIYFDNQKYYIKDIDYILPYTSYNFNVNIPFSFFGIRSPNSIVITFLGQKLTLPGTKSAIIQSNLLIVFLLVIFIFLLTITKTKRLNIQILKYKLTNIFKSHIGNVTSKIKTIKFK